MEIILQIGLKRGKKGGGRVKRIGQGGKGAIFDLSFEEEGRGGGDISLSLHLHVGNGIYSLYSKVIGCICVFVSVCHLKSQIAEQIMLLYVFIFPVREGRF